MRPETSGDGFFTTFLALPEALGIFFGAKRRFRWADRSAIEAYQLRRAVSIARRAAREVPFFRRHHAGRDPRDFFTLPSVSKRDMMANLDDFTTTGYSGKAILDFCLENEKTRDFGRRLGGYVCVLSTGTSGSRGVEIVSPREELLLKAAFLARFPFVPGEGLRAAFILRVFSPGLRFDHFGHRVEYVDPLVPFPEMAARIDAIGPNLISGPPQVLKLLALEKLAGRLEAAPKRLVSYGETLWPDVRSLIEGAFGCRVDEIYKCTEAAVAMPCREGRLHVNEDLVLLEVLDVEGRPAPPGTPSSRLLVTDLLKRSCPIIRHELNDIVTISPEPCPCGSSFRVIESIQGRVDDTFYFPALGGGSLLPFLPDFVARAVVSSLPEALEWCAIQEAPDRVLVRVETGGDGPEQAHVAALSVRLAEAFLASGCEPPEIRVEEGSTGAGDLERKFRRVRRDFALPEN